MQNVRQEPAALERLQIPVASDDGETECSRVRERSSPGRTPLSSFAVLSWMCSEVSSSPAGASNAHRNFEPYIKSG